MSRCNLLVESKLARLVARASRVETMLKRLVFRAPSANPSVRADRTAAWLDTSLATKKYELCYITE